MIGQKGIPTKTGGIERHVEALALNLVNQKHQVFVYTRANYTNKNLKEYKGVKLISLPTIHSKNLETAFHTFVATLHASLLIKDLDIIHYHGIGPALFSWLPRLLKPSIKVISTFHCQDYYHQKWSWLARKFLKLGEKFSVLFSHDLIVVSKQLKKYVKETYNHSANYIPNGVEIYKNTDISKAQKQSLSWWNLKPKQYIITVSRLVRHKNIHLLIQAHQSLSQSIRKQRKLVIVGDSAFTDNYKKELKKLAKNDKNIIFTGQQNGRALELLFRNAYLFVQPSSSEGLSFALLEALNYEVPTLVSNIPANLEIVGKNTFTFKNKSLNDLSHQLSSILNLPHKKLQKKVTLLKQKVTNEYSWIKIVRAVEKIYRKNTSREPRVLFSFKGKQI